MIVEALKERISIAKQIVKIINRPAESKALRLLVVLTIWHAGQQIESLL